MIIPVVLEKDFKTIEQKIKLVEDVAKLIQIDVADGKLVNGRTFDDPEKLSELKAKCPLEIHLMVENPIIYLRKKYENVVNIISQVEAWKYTEEFITKAHGLGYKVGLSINPDTSLNSFKQFVKEVDFVQFMTVVPGSQGKQPFIPEVLVKIKEFKKMFPNVPVQNDGGVRPSNLQQVLQAGVDNVVIGSEIFGSKNPKDRFLELSKFTTMPKDKVSTIFDGNANPKKIRKIAFLGGASWKENEQPFIDALEVSKLLAQNDYEIVNGGGPGVMKASTMGAHAAGKRSLAITYHPNKPKIHYEGTDPKNKFDEEIITLDYFDRTKVMLQNTDVHIIFKGSIGTLSEFGMTWVSSWIHEPDSKPIIMYGAFWNEILDVIEKNMLIKNGERDMLKVCTTPQEVLEYIKSLEK